MVLAADDRIERAGRAAGVEVVRIEAPCRNGSERVARALRSGRLGAPAPALVVNLQADAVGATPELLCAAVEALRDDPAAELATVAVRARASEHDGRTTVRLGVDGYAADFSRRPLPGGPGEAGLLLHVGIYAYRSGALLEVAASAPSPREQAESLEQLRWLEAGHRIAVRVVDGGPGLAAAVDHPADLRPELGAPGA